MQDPLSLLRLLRRPLTTRRPPLRRHALDAWSNSQPGASVLRMEDELVSDWVADLFGYYLVQVGEAGFGHWIARSRIQTRVVVQTDACNRPADDAANDAGEAARPAGIGGEITRVCGSSTDLPIASDSVDVVVLPHLLEYEADPHAALREASRILIPEGHLVITGFSPFSALGLGARWEHPFRADKPRNAELRMIRAQRARDWMSVLGLEPLRYEARFVRPPLRSQRVLDRLQWLEDAGAALPMLGRLGGGTYAVLARKRVSTMTPLRPISRRSVRLVPPTLVGASAGMGTSAASTAAGASERSSLAPLRARPRLVRVSGRDPELS